MALQKLKTIFLLDIKVFGKKHENTQSALYSLAEAISNYGNEEQAFEII